MFFYLSRAGLCPKEVPQGGQGKFDAAATVRREQGNDLPLPMDRKSTTSPRRGRG